MLTPARQIGAVRPAGFLVAASGVGTSILTKAAPGAARFNNPRYTVVEAVKVSYLTHGGSVSVDGQDMNYPQLQAWADGIFAADPRCAHCKSLVDESALHPGQQRFCDTICQEAEEQMELAWLDS